MLHRLAYNLMNLVMVMNNQLKQRCRSYEIIRTKHFPPTAYLRLLKCNLWSANPHLIATRREARLLLPLCGRQNAAYCTPPPTVASTPFLGQSSYQVTITAIASTSKAPWWMRSGRCSTS